MVVPACSGPWRAWQGGFSGGGIILFPDVDGLAPQTGFRHDKEPGLNRSAAMTYSNFECLHRGDGVPEPSLCPDMTTPAAWP